MFQAKQDSKSSVPEDVQAVAGASLSVWEQLARDICSCMAVWHQGQGSSWYEWIRNKKFPMILIWMKMYAEHIVAHMDFD